MTVELCIVTDSNKIIVFHQPTEAMSFFLENTLKRKIYKLRTWGWNNYKLEEMEVSEMLYEACINTRTSTSTGSFVFTDRAFIGNGPSFPIHFGKTKEETQQKMLECFQKRLEVRDSKRTDAFDRVSPHDIFNFLVASCCVPLENLNGELRISGFPERRVYVLDFLKPFFRMLGVRVDTYKHDT